MGICKCRKRTDLFCFVHKKAVCETCIHSDHYECVVRTYVQWLKDSDYDQPVCGICKGEFEKGNVVRLTCFDLFHPECIDVYGSSLPSHTAQAGFVCPTCVQPMIPSDKEAEENPLARKFRDIFAESSWLTRQMPSSSHEEVTHGESESNETIVEITDAKDSTSSPIAPTPAAPVTQYSQPSSGIASRFMKSHSATYDPGDEEEGDKYRKRGVTDLCVGLGLMSKPIESPPAKRLSVKRVMILLVIISIFVTLFVISNQITTAGDEGVVVDGPKYID